MKQLLLVITTIALVGCSSTMQLPSVTVGGAANKDAVLDAKLDKTGVGLTAPLVSIDVPFPSVKAADSKKK